MMNVHVGVFEVVVVMSVGVTVGPCQQCFFFVKNFHFEVGHRSFDHSTLVDCEMNRNTMRSLLLLAVE